VRCSLMALNPESCEVARIRASEIWVAAVAQ